MPTSERENFWMQQLDTWHAGGLSQNRHRSPSPALPANSLGEPAY